MWLFVIDLILQNHGINKSLKETFMFPIRSEPKLLIKTNIDQIV